MPDVDAERTPLQSQSLTPTRLSTPASHAATNSVQLTSDLAVGAVSTTANTNVQRQPSSPILAAPAPAPPLPPSPNVLLSLLRMSPVVEEPEEEILQIRPWRRAVETPERVAEWEHSSIQQPNNKGTQSQSVSSQDPPTEDTSGWPAHMVDAKMYLTQEAVGVNEISVVKARDWGDGWIGCMQEFIDFQKCANFPDTGPSSTPATDVHPVQIATWMKNQRPWKDVEVFRQQWWAWWLLFQPDSRILKDTPTPNMDWSKL